MSLACTVKRLGSRGVLISTASNALGVPAAHEF
jgi:hypothetical protein